MTTSRPRPALDPAAFARLDTDRIGRKLFFVASAASTNDVAFDLLEGGLPEGTTVFAEEQTRGRGRKGRTWHSAPGLGLWFSIVLRPEIPAERFSAITATVAVALRQAIETSTGLAPRIAWPNDLVVGPCKLGGILVEARNLDPRRPAFVLGIGLDVNQTLEDFAPEIRDRATSLAIEIKRDVDRVGLAIECLECLDLWYDRLLRGDTTPIDDALRSGAALVGQRVVLELGGAFHRGVVLGVSLASGIRLRLDSGEERAFPGEQVSLRVLPA